jgi:predicted nucleic acid-binding protein
MNNAGAGLCFIDSNIWLYAFVQSQDQKKSALAQAAIQSTGIVISSQVINEICFNLIRKANFNESDIQILIESFYRSYEVIEIRKAEVLKASQLRTHYKFSFWDSLIVSCALASGANKLFSEDMNTGLIVENQLEIINPLISI